MASADLLTPNLNMKRRRSPMLLNQQVIDPAQVIGTPQWQERQNHLQKIAADAHVATQARLLQEELERRQARAAAGIKTRAEAIDGVKQENPLPDPTRHTVKARGPKKNPSTIGGMAEVPHKTDRRKERERNRPRRPITEL